MVEDKLSSFENSLINKYISLLLTEKDLRLLKLIFLQEPSQQELDEFLSNYDIEAAGSYKVLLLSYFMKMHPQLKFTDYETPRLKGLLNFYRFQNMKLISYFMKIGQVFKENHIQMMILKGLAIKHLRPDLPRAMGDIDVLVFGEDFIKAIKLCQKMGYRLSVEPHSVDIHEPSSEAGMMDIHRWNDMGNERGHLLNEYLLKRAKPIKVGGLDVLIPSNEDLLFLSLVNLSKNLFERTSKAATLYVLFDCKFLLEQSGFDIKVVIENIKLTHTDEQVAFAIKFINTIIPNLIPKEIYNQKIFRKNSVKLLFKKYFKPLQILARSIKFKDIFCQKVSFLRYAKVKLHYKFCKFIVNKDFVAVKKCILERRMGAKR